MTTTPASMTDPDDNLRACENCYGDYDPNVEGADGLCEQCYGDQFDDEETDDDH